MKANEIQIEDWLYYKGQFNAFPFKVESITKKKVGYHAEPNEYHMHYLRLSECKPIPLTPEILEKNGFYENQDRWWWKDFYITLASTKALTLVCNRTIQFDYVHQLQHALRICGIEKEIEL